LASDVDALDLCAPESSVLRCRVASPSGSAPAVKVGVLALQGAFAAHAAALRSVGAEPREIRTPDQLAEVDALILPGGESTTMSMLLESSDLFDPLAERLAAGLPTLGTCAGMILLGAEILDGRADQRCFGAVDISVRRNAFGRQVDSFEADLPLDGLDGGPFPAVFIRAPFVERAGADVEVLATVDGHPVLCRQGHVTVAAFHPELSHDLRLHAQLLKEI
jgi:5'-phosphate synthase pdxT subunit